jgi:hypothetical protein
MFFTVRCLLLMKLSPEGCVAIIRYELETWELPHNLLEERKEPAKTIAG